MEKVKNAGYVPLLYSNQSWLMNKLDYERLKKYKLWYAAPGASAPKYNPTIWQYSWKGKINGIIGDVDMDYLYDETLIKSTPVTKSTTNTSTTVIKNDKEVFLNQARTYIGKNGNYVCNTKLKLGGIYNWCAFSVSLIMKDCGFIGKYINAIQGGAGDIPRYSDGKYGTWFAKGTKAPQAGDLIFFRYAGAVPTDKYFSSHVGIVETVNGNTLTTLEGNVEGQNGNWAATSTFKRKTRYLSNSDVYAFYRPNWKNTTTTSTNTTTTTTTSTNTTSTSSTIDVIYQVYAGGRWLPEVKNLEDYAGLENKPIQGIYMKPTKGHLRYRVKLIGSKNYLPWVIDKNDYAGILGKNIDCVQVELTDCNGYVAQYRVSTTSSTNYLNWITGYNTNNDMGYAGIINKPIDKLQVKIIKK